MARREFRCLFLFLLILASGGPAQAWTRTLSGTGNALNRGVATAFDSKGDAIIGGENDGIYTVAKLRGADGQVQWRTDAGLPAVGACERVRAVAVTEDDDVLAAGRGCDAPVVTAWELRLRKLDGATGAELWTYNLWGSYGLTDVAIAEDVVLDSAGNAFVIGHVTNGTPTRIVVMVAKVAPNGSELWLSEYDSSLPFAEGPDFGFSAAVDSAGNVAVAGQYGGWMALVKLDGSNGAKLWEAKVDPAGVGIGTATAVAVDSQDDFVVVGRTGPDLITVANYTIAKFSGVNGSMLWHEIYPPGFAVDVAVDASDDVISTGTIGFGSARAIKSSGSDGSELWSSDAPTWNTDNSEARLTLLPGGDVAVSGATVTRLAGSDGGTMWVHTPSPWLAQLTGHGIAVDGNGDVAVVGRAQHPGNEYFVTASKIDGADGTVFFQGPSVPGLAPPILAIALVVATLAAQRIRPRC